MAEDNQEMVNKEQPMNEGGSDKSSETKVEDTSTAAPAMDETAMESGSTEAPDAEDIGEMLAVLNVADEEVGGKGGITDVPGNLRKPIGYLVDKLLFLRQLFDDPKWQALVDDLHDQREDGKTPSVEVAIARTIPLEKLQELADTEDYEGVQSELAVSLEAKGQEAEAEAQFAEKFQASQKAGDEYAAEMGYDDAEKNALFQVVLDLFKVMGDGVLTKDEWSKVDKLRNYDKDVADLKSQIETQGSKEALPDQASMDAAINASKQPKQAPKPVNAPGMSSMSAYENATDITSIGKRKRTS